METGEDKLHTFYGHMDITAVSFSPNGKHLVSAGGTFDPTIELWDAEIYKMLPPKEYPPEIVGINKGFIKAYQNGKSIMHERTEKVATAETRCEKKSKMDRLKKMLRQ